MEGSGTDDVDVTLKEAVKTSPADALRPGISTVILSPEIEKVRPGKVLEIKDTPVKAGSVSVRMMLRFGPAVMTCVRKSESGAAETGHVRIVCQDQ